MRVMGIDPGTRSFDVVLLEDGVVRSEYSFDTLSIASDPTPLLDVVRLMDVDVIVAPSGYGVPVTWGSEVLDARRFALELLLLTDPLDIEQYLEEPGVQVYRALAKVVEELIKTSPEKTLFIPSVVLLPTVPWYRKINKVDMGTADKLAATVLAVHQVSVRESLDYGDVNIVVVEMGYGYTGVVAVRNGVVVDGIGGTSASIGPMTSGALDLEVVVGARVWRRWSILHGGLKELAGTLDPLRLLERAKAGDSLAGDLLELYVEAIVKDVSRALVTTKADMVVVTGRNARIQEIKRMMEEKLGIEVSQVDGLKGARDVKEAAQGYAMIGDGLKGGIFKELVEHMKIAESCGTVTDYIVHPDALKFKERVRRAYEQLVVNPKLCSKNLP